MCVCVCVYVCIYSAQAHHYQNLLLLCLLERSKMKAM